MGCCSGLGDSALLGLMLRGCQVARWLLQLQPSRQGWKKEVAAASFTEAKASPSPAAPWLLAHSWETWESRGGGIKLVLPQLWLLTGAGTLLLGPDWNSAHQVRGREPWVEFGVDPLLQ